MEFIKLSDQDLINSLKGISDQEKELAARMVKMLLEVERRKLHLARGYPSLFAFCVDALGYSESEAFRRIQAMKLSRDVPLVEEKIHRGEISLSVAALAQTQLRRVEKEGQPVPPAAKVALVENLCGSTYREAERKIASILGAQPAPPEKERALASGSTRIEFNASPELMRKLGLLKNLFAHQNFSGRYDVLVEKLADLALAQIRKPRKSLVDAPSLAAQQVKITRHIPMRIRRHVYTRDQGRCQYRDPVTGKACHTTHGVQLDHIVEFARGGRHDPENLRLLCGAHNRWRSGASSGSGSSPNATAPPSPRRNT